MGYSERLATLWQEFESRSNSLAESLEQQMENVEAVPVVKKTEREIAVRAYRIELHAFVEGFLKQEYRAKFDNTEDIGKFADKLVDKKYLPAEEQNHSKR